MLHRREDILRRRQIVLQKGLQQNAAHLSRTQNGHPQPRHHRRRNRDLIDYFVHTIRLPDLLSHRATLLARNPAIHLLLQHIHRQRARVQHHVMKLPYVELRSQRLLAPAPAAPESSTAPSCTPAPAPATRYSGPPPPECSSHPSPSAHGSSPPSAAASSASSARPYPPPAGSPARCPPPAARSRCTGPDRSRSPCPAARYTAPTLRYTPCSKPACETPAARSAPARSRSADDVPGIPSWYETASTPASDRSAKLYVFTSTCPGRFPSALPWS